jgi:putative SOS response-associated peptidase YedK
MCSRYFLDADGNIIAYTFQVPVHERIRKRFNIAPTQLAPVIRVGEDGAREVEMLRWGLVPFWAKDPAVGTRMINARAESVEAKPAFRAAIRQRRCLVPATGFFEWKGAPGQKQPYAITLAQRPLFAFAGLWERWQPSEGAPLETFTIVTTEPNDSVAEIHDRMPVILPRESEEAWLRGDAVEACKHLTPYAGAMALRPVSRVVSSPKNDVPECLNDAEPGWPSQQQLL